MSDSTAKNPSEKKLMVKDALTLTVITIIFGFLLGLVYEITLQPIANANEAANQAAYKAVFEDADSFEQIDGFDSDKATEIAKQTYPDNDDTITNALEAKDSSGQVLGYVITITAHDSYGGDVVFHMGVTNDGVMNGYSITTSSDTPGLGQKATDSTGSFAKQFASGNVTADKQYSVDKSKSDPANGTIQAISGATITSNAVTNGVNFGFAYFNSLTGGAS